MPRDPVVTAPPREVVESLCAIAASGRGLDARHDVTLSTALREWWPRDTHGALLACLGALDPQRREALVMGDGARVAWRYLSACEPSRVASRAVFAAARDTRDRSFPSGCHEVVAALSRLGPAAERPIALALDGPFPTRAGRRVLVAALARLDGEHAALHAALTDPDALVRRLARDGLDRRGTPAPLMVRAPEPFAQARADRAAVTPDRRRAVSTWLLAASREAASARCRVDDVISLRPLPFASLCAAWIDALRRWRWEPAFALYEVAMRQQLSPDDPMTPWRLADALCALPPDDRLPVQRCATLLALPRATLLATARALGEVLAPEDVGNPAALYGWIAARCPPDAPAFVRGLVDPDPAVRLLCAKVTGRRLG